MKYLLKRDNGFFIKKFKELSPADLKAVSSDVRIKILNELRKEPMYPNQLAKKLRLHEQKVYYHVNALKKAGLLKVVRTEEVKGSIANYYGVKADSFGVELDCDYETINFKEGGIALAKFFSEFNKNGFFNGLIVVGSPLPHGPFKAVARDGHYAAQLGLLLGGFSKPVNFCVRLDTDVISEKLFDNNLVIIGGPGTNLVTSLINDYLPVRFNSDNYWSSIIGREEFTGDSCGLIVKIANPFSKGKFIIVLAGLRVVGTKSAIIGLMNPNKVFSDYDGGLFSRVIKGFDFNGDGKIDGVEILE